MWEGVVALAVVAIIEGIIIFLVKRKKAPTGLFVETDSMFPKFVERVEHHGLSFTLNERASRVDCRVAVPERIWPLEICDGPGMALYGKHLAPHMPKTKNVVFNGTFTQLNKVSSESLDLIDDPEVQAMLMDLHEGLDAVWLKDGELRFPTTRKQVESLDITAEFLVEVFSQV